MTNADLSPALSQSQDEISGFEPMLGTMPAHTKPTRLERVRRFLNWSGRWQQPILIQQLENPDPTLRERAVRNLRVVGTSRAVPHLLQLLKQEKEPTIRFQAVRSLARIGDHQTHPTILKLAREEEDKRVRLMALWALGEMKILSGLPLLLDSMHNPDPVVRRIAITALNVMKNRQAADTLIRALSDPDPVVRWFAITGVSRLQDNQAIDGLVTCLDDPFPRQMFGKTIAENAAAALVLQPQIAQQKRLSGRPS